MARVLLAWELGLGFGHVQRLIAIADALASANHIPVLALKSLAGPSELLVGSRYTLLQAPVWPELLIRAGGVANRLSGIMTATGMAIPSALLLMTQAWQNILDVYQIDLVVADHSPTVCLATYSNCPTLIVGNAYTVPPLIAPTVEEEALLDIIQFVQNQRKKPIPTSVSDIYGKAKRLVLTFPELDPHQALREDPVVGPAEMPSGPIVFRNDIKNGPKLFAYLAAEYSWTETILSGLASRGISIEAFVRGATPELTQRLQSKGVHVFLTPPTLVERLAECSAILHHGGAGTAESALIAGRPQILLPRYVEQELTAQLLENLSVGVTPAGRLNGNQFTELVREVLHDSAKRHLAQELAASVVSRGPWEGIKHVVETCEELLANTN